LSGIEETPKTGFPWAGGLVCVSLIKSISMQKVFWYGCLAEGVNC